MQTERSLLTMIRSLTSNYLSVDKIIALSIMCFLISCTSYIANNQYAARKIERTQSININFDLLLDEDISINDPRIKSIIFASNKNSHIVITYTNPNAEKLACKIAMILTHENLIVVKPQLIEAVIYKKLNKYVVVYIKYE